MKRIDIFTQFSKNYSHENYIAKQLLHAFKKLGIPASHLCLQDGTLGNYLLDFERKPASYILSFVDLFIGENLLCDELRIPHFFWSRKGLSESLHYLSRPFGWVGISDPTLSEKMQKWGYERTAFLPPGIDPALQGFPEEERCYEVAFFEDLVDTDFLERVWKDLFSPMEIEILYQCIRECQSNLTLHPLEALFMQLSIRSMKISDVQFTEILNAIESCLKAGYAQKGIESLTCQRIDVFGEHIGNNWLKRLRNGKNVYLHGALPYTEHFEVLKRSKVLVRLPAPSLTHFDEWVFPALVQGCMVIQPETSFSRQLYQGIESGFYSMESFILDELVHRHLKFRKSTLGMLKGLRQVFIEKHAWDVRALSLLEMLP